MSSTLRKLNTLARQVDRLNALIASPHTAPERLPQLGQDRRAVQWALSLLNHYLKPGDPILAASIERFENERLERKAASAERRAARLADRVPQTDTEETPDAR